MSVFDADILSSAHHVKRTDGRKKLLHPAEENLKAVTRCHMG